MVIRKKCTRDQIVSSDIEKAVAKVINRGGKTLADNELDADADEIRFTLRLPKKLLMEIDSIRKTRVGKLSRNQFIVEALNKAAKYTQKT